MRLGTLLSGNTVSLKKANMELILTLIMIALIAIEWAVGRIRGTSKYNLRNSIINSVLGGIVVFSEFICTLIALPIFVWIYKEHSLFTLDNSTLLSFAVLFLAVDFFDYWYHRLSHKINLMWTAHIVHHQSEYYNITVGLRASFLVPVFNIMGYAVFPLLGFDPDLVLPILLITGLYNLVIHTEFIGKLGWLEYVFVTPSSHRVHHAKNEEYMDKNFGKLFSFWDLLFGTYIKEKPEEKIEFGVADIRGGDGIGESLFFPMKKIAVAFCCEKSWKKKLKIIFGSPSEAERIYKERKRLIPMEEGAFVNRTEKNSSLSLAVLICGSIFLFSSCAVSNRYLCKYPTKENEWKEKGLWDIREKEFMIGISAGSDWLKIKPSTNIPIYNIYRDSLRLIKCTQLVPVTKSGDTLELQEEKDGNFYFSSNRATKIDKSKKIKLSVVYDVDSLGSICTTEKTYIVHRKTYRRLAVH
jgi:alkylglycerol monooxygenase